MHSEDINASKDERLQIAKSEEIQIVECGANAQYDSIDQRYILVAVQLATMKESSRIKRITCACELC